MDPVYLGITIIIGMVLMITNVILYTRGYTRQLWTLTRNATHRALYGPQKRQDPQTLTSTPDRPYPDFSTAYEASQWGEDYATQHPIDDPAPQPSRTDPPPAQPSLGCECAECHNTMTLTLNPPKIVTVDIRDVSYLRIRDTPHHNATPRRTQILTHGQTLTITHTRFHFARQLGGGWVLADHLRLTPNQSLASWIDLHTAPPTDQDQEYRLP